MEREKYKNYVDIHYVVSSAPLEGGENCTKYIYRMLYWLCRVFCDPLNGSKLLWTACLLFCIFFFPVNDIDIVSI